MTDSTEQVDTYRHSEGRTMCYGCLENALREVAPAVAAGQGNAEASPGTVEIFKSAVPTLRSISGWGAVEHPLPAAAQILAVQMQVWCTRTPYAFTAPPPTRMFQFLHNVFIRMSTVEDVNPRNVATPGIGRISECVGELLLQLRDSAAKAHISSSAEIAGHGKGLFAESFAAVLVPAASPAPAPAATWPLSATTSARSLSGAPPRSLWSLPLYCLESAASTLFPACADIPASLRLPRPGCGAKDLG